jgi:hypothetical protein
MRAVMIAIATTTEEISESMRRRRSLGARDPARVAGLMVCESRPTADRMELNPRAVLELQQARDQHVNIAGPVDSLASPDRCAMLRPWCLDGASWLSGLAVRSAQIIDLSTI